MVLFGIKNSRKKLKEKNDNFNSSDYYITAQQKEKELMNKGYVHYETAMLEGTKDNPTLKVHLYENPTTKKKIAVFSEESWFEPIKNGKRLDKKNMYYGREYGALIYSAETDKKNASDLFGLAQYEHSKFEEAQKDLYKSWENLSVSEREKTMMEMKKFNHIKYKSEAKEEYENNKRFWGILK